jgi:hypothetical protein
MKYRIITFFLLGFVFGVLSLGVNAQGNADPDDVEQQINELEAKNIDDFSASLKKIYKDNLLYLYRSYVAALDRQIALLTNIPDPKGDFAKKKAEYKKSKARTEVKIVIVEQNLAIQGKGGKAEVDPEDKKDDGKKGHGKNEATKEDDKKDLGKKEDGNKDKIKVDENKDETSATAKEPSICDVVKDDLKNNPPKIDATKNTFDKASPALIAEATTVAKLILEVINNQTGAAGEESPLETAMQNYSTLFPLTLAQSIEKDDDKTSAILNLKPFQFLPETYRTDKQVGASSSTMASTSAIDKPGFASLLGFAIENGFVEKNAHDTVLTLSTSPVALFSLSEKDPLTAYQNTGFYNKLGFSASFNINSENPLLANATRSQLREFSVRYRFLGDRSARSEGIQKIWSDTISPKIRELLAAIGNVKEVVDANKDLQELRNATQCAFGKTFETMMAGKSYVDLKTDAEREVFLTNFILGFTKTFIFDGVRNGQTKFDEKLKAALRKSMNELLAVQKAYAFDVIKDALDAEFKKPLGTVAYINHRDPMGNFSEFKLLIEKPSTLIKPLSLFLNAGVSYYHKPNPMMNQKKLRDFNLALSLEGKIKRRFNVDKIGEEPDFNYVEDGDLSEITYSFTGRYSRMLANQNMMNRKADLLTAQFLLDFPLFRGISLPFSVSYSNATELERKQGFRVNFSLKFDGDKLAALNGFKKFF